MYFFQPFDFIFGPLREPTSLDVRDNDAHLERFVNLSPHIYLWDLWQIWGMLYVLCLMMFIWKDLSATSGALYATMRYSDPKYNWKQLTQQTNKKQTNKHTHTTNKQTHKQQAIITYQSISTSLSIIQSCQVQSISTVLLIEFKVSSQKISRGYLGVLSQLSPFGNPPFINTHTHTQIHFVNWTDTFASCVLLSKRPEVEEQSGGFCFWGCSRLTEVDESRGGL